MAQMAGLSRDHFGRLERGDEPGTLGSWAAIAFVLGVDLSEFGTPDDEISELIRRNLEALQQVRAVPPPSGV